MTDPAQQVGDRAPPIDGAPPPPTDPPAEPPSQPPAALPSQPPAAPAAGDRNKVLAAAVVIIALMLVGGGFLAWQAFKEPGGAAPDFTVTTTGFENGNQTEPYNFTLSQHRGKVILIDMMAVHCPGCDILSKEVVRPLYQEYGNRSDFLVLSVDVWSSDEANQGFGGESNEDIIGFQKDHDAQWPHAQDTDDVFRKYSTVPIPMLVLIDQDGDIVMEKRGLPSLASVESEVQSALAGESEAIDVIRLSLPLMALVAGVASFFAPCSVGLIPAYLGILLKGNEKVTDAERFGKTLRGGLATALGIISLYVIIAALLYVASDFIQPILVNAVPYIAIALILFGLAMFRTGLWDGLARRMGMGKVDGRRGFFAFGVGYGLAAFGCTGPIFLPVLLAAFGVGAAAGFGVFAIYAIAVASLVLLAAGLVASGHSTGLRKMLSKTDQITKVAGVLVIAGAIWIWSTHYRATGGWF